MGRAPVRAEQRRRTAQACDSCKASKIRCDSLQPCISCLRRRRPDSCVYSSGAPLQHHRPRRQTSGAVARTEDDVATRPASPDGGPVAAESSVAVASSSSSTHGGAALPSPAQTTVDNPTMRVLHNRILVNSKGEKVYLGHWGPFSFLQFLRQTLRQHVGPSRFSDNRQIGTMLEVELDQPPRTDRQVPLSRNARRAFAEHFMRAIHGFVDFYGRDDVFSLAEIGRRSSSADNGSDHSIHQWLILAIGAQARNSGPEDASVAATYFSLAQKKAFEDMLAYSSINVVCTFCLMAFYMFSACRRNTACLYLGVASSVACSLGLHLEESSRGAEPAELAFRSRVWKSLRILDVITASMLGRPALSSFSQDPAPYRRAGGVPDTVSLDAAYEACTIIDEIAKQLSATGNLESATVENFLLRLRTWSQNLPASVRAWSKASTLPEEHSVPEMLSGYRVIAHHYFTILLLTRSFLISHLLQHLPGSKVEAHPRDPEKTLDFMNVCVESASCLADLCMRLSDLGLLSRGMCLFKVCAFSSALVLGISLVIDETRSEESRAGFEAMRTFMGRYTDTVPQAAHYSDILNSFSDAIDMYLQAIRRERRRSARRYIGDVDLRGVATSTSAAVSEGVDASEAAPAPDLTETTFDWDDLGLWWDDTPLDMNTFGQLFDPM